MQLSVTDNGPGIPADLQPTLFERFVRGDTARTHHDGQAASTGLGLAIVDAVTTAHGGTVHLDSQTRHHPLHHHPAPARFPGAGRAPAFIATAETGHRPGPAGPVTVGRTHPRSTFPPLAATGPSRPGRAAATGPARALGKVLARSAGRTLPMSSTVTGARRFPARAGPAPPWPAGRLLRGPEHDPRWARPGLLGLLALTAILYTAGLSRNGWANDFYSAAVQAGATSWKAFFFGSFDSSSFITVDKTPASLWVMELSVRVFGLNSWSVLLPQAAEGVAAVGILYAAVRRWAGPAAGLIAAAALACTPVATLMFRFNNPDALLVLLLTAAAYAMVRAIESGRTRWLVLAGALLGIGFLTKMLQAFLVLPGFALVYLVAGSEKHQTHGREPGGRVYEAVGWVRL